MIEAYRKETNRTAAFAQFEAAVQAASLADLMAGLAALDQWKTMSDLKLRAIIKKEIENRGTK